MELSFALLEKVQFPDNWQNDQKLQYAALENKYQNLETRNYFCALSLGEQFETPVVRQAERGKPVLLW
ncbi:MAG: hypothetical protein O3B18_03835 [Proteobacteria bacterium]|nr:hypothetical protein [Pseudomonadota bacterium]MDA0884045.1 hypothetical protein [Pseudomonadota bacterium]MDA1150366.1 hypothetical protein [Pseudomonadota bacterium]